MNKKYKINNDDIVPVIAELLNKGFKDFWNEYCPCSRFYTSEIENTTVYVRKDVIEDNVYEFESWSRDNTKDIFAKDLDSNRRLYTTKGDLGILIKVIRGEML